MKIKFKLPKFLRRKKNTFPEHGEIRIGDTECEICRYMYISGDYPIVTTKDGYEVSICPKCRTSVFAGNIHRRENSTDTYIESLIRTDFEHARVSSIYATAVDTPTSIYAYEEIRRAAFRAAKAMLVIMREYNKANPDLTFISPD